MVDQETLHLLRRALQAVEDLEEEEERDADNSNSDGGMQMSVSSIIFYSALTIFVLTQILIKGYHCFVSRGRTAPEQQAEIYVEQDPRRQHKQTKAEKRRNLSDTFEEQQVLKEISIDDFIPSDGSNKNTEDTSDQHEEDDIEQGTGATMMGPDAMIRLPGFSSEVPNCCAICLSEYCPGETVVWSSNHACKHVFHQECLVEYLIKVKDESIMPCPMCRQSFVTLKKKADEGEEKEEQQGELSPAE